MSSPQLIEQAGIMQSPVSIKTYINVHGLHTIHVSVSGQLAEVKCDVHNTQLEGAKSMLIGKWMHITLAFRQYFDDERTHHETALAD